LAAFSTCGPCHLAQPEGWQPLGIVLRSLCHIYYSQESWQWYWLDLISFRSYLLTV